VFYVFCEFYALNVLFNVMFSPNCHYFLVLKFLFLYTSLKLKFYKIFVAMLILCAFCIASLTSYLLLDQ